MSRRTFIDNLSVRQKDIFIQQNFMQMERYLVMLESNNLPKHYSRNQIHHFMDIHVHNIEAYGDLIEE